MSLEVKLQSELKILKTKYVKKLENFRNYCVRIINQYSKSPQYFSFCNDIIKFYNTECQKVIGEYYITQKALTFRNQVKDMINQSRKIIAKHFKKESKFETVFIDFRVIDHVEFLIRNVIYKFNDNWCHTVVCGNNNYEYMKILCESISKNIKIIKLDIDNLNQKTYSNLLQTKEFWNLFHSEKIFLYQEDTLVFKDNIEDFIEFDFIGAPWNKKNLGYNGGCCLRTRDIMLKCLEKEKPYFPEDKYYCKTIQKHNLGKLPEYNIAIQFGEENVNSNDIPFCGHQFWRSGNKKLENLKEIKCFEYIFNS